MTADTSISNHIELEPDSAARLANLCGRLDEHLRQIENHLGVKITHRGNSFKITGNEAAVNATSSALAHLYAETATGETLNPNAIHLALGETSQALDGNADTPAKTSSGVFIRTPKSSVKPRSPHQREYVESIRRHDINFGIGPAGTGKTYLAVACAVEALVSERVNRLLLVRPAVEAGEKLGFLPGSLVEKVNPYLRPLYDALYEMMGFDRVAKLIERNVIEVAPLAFMRGRSLNDSFIILDEAQNTTVEQMKMFLTRIGFGSRAVVTGDPTQTDLPPGKPSGLRHAIDVLHGVHGVAFQFFEARDVVRHPLVQRIVQAYEARDT